MIWCDVIWHTESTPETMVEKYRAEKYRVEKYGEKLASVLINFCKMGVMMRTTEGHMCQVIILCNVLSRLFGTL